jgi:hypothetical protein
MTLCWCGFCKRIWEVADSGIWPAVYYCPERKCGASIFTLPGLKSVEALKPGDVLMACEEPDNGH